MPHNNVLTNKFKHRRNRPEISVLASSAAALRAREQLDRAKRIVLLTKCRYMGDTLVATPFMSQLRKHFPNAEISLVTAPSVATALKNTPDIDKIVPMEMRGVARLQYCRELYEAVSKVRYDAAFLLDRSLRCAVIAAMAKIPVRVGYLNEHRRPFLTVPIPYSFNRHEVDCHLDMLRAVGLGAEDSLPTLWISPEERILASKAVNISQQDPAQSTSPIIGFQPGANDADIREWGAERYAHVADKLVAETGCRIVIMGGASESATADRMQASMRFPSINLAGKLDLRTALASIGLCDYWIGNDTGLLHAAVSQRVPTVGLFGPNKVVRWGYDTDEHRSLVVFPETPAQDDEAVRKCLDAITEEQVLESIFNLMDPERRSIGIPLNAIDGLEIAARSPYFRSELAPIESASTRRR